MPDIDIFNAGCYVSIGGVKHFVGAGGGTIASAKSGDVISPMVEVLVNKDVAFMAMLINSVTGEVLKQYVFKNGHPIGTWLDVTLDTIIMPTSDLHLQFYTTNENNTIGFDSGAVFTITYSGSVITPPVPIDKDCTIAGHHVMNGNTYCDYGLKTLWKCVDGQPIPSGTCNDAPDIVLSQDCYYDNRWFADEADYCDEAGRVLWKCSNGTMKYVSPCNELPGVLGTVSCDFTMVPAAPKVGETVTFTPISCFGNPTYTFWDFGDESTSKAVIGITPVTHIYPKAGTFKPGLSISSLSDNGYKEKSITVTGTVVSGGGGAGGSGDGGAVITGCSPVCVAPQFCLNKVCRSPDTVSMCSPACILPKVCYNTSCVTPDGAAGSATPCVGMNRKGAMDPTCILEKGNEMYLYAAVGAIVLLLLLKKK